MAWAAAQRLRGLKNRGCGTFRPHRRAEESSRAGGSNVNRQCWICPMTLLSKEPVDARSLYGFKRTLGNCM